jgi:chromosomal replication initiation ATPase DnaA
MLKKCINDSYELDKITNVVSEYTGVPIEKLMHKTRVAPVNEARQLAMYFIKGKTRASLKFIGHYFQRNDHTPVINGIKRVKNGIDTDKGFKLMTIELDMEIDRMINEQKNNHSPEVNENLDVLQELKNQI